MRKLGVDPDTIVGNHSGMSSGPDAEDYLEEDLSQVIEPADLDPDLCTPFNVVAVPASATNELDSSGDDSCGLHSRTVGRLRHLDILEEVGFYTKFTNQNGPRIVKIF